jgi:hypothetical protein
VRRGRRQEAAGDHTEWPEVKTVENLVLARVYKEPRANSAASWVTWVIIRSAPSLRKKRQGPANPKSQQDLTGRLWHGRASSSAAAVAPPSVWINPLHEGGRERGSTFRLGGRRLDPSTARSWGSAEGSGPRAFPRSPERMNCSTKRFSLNGQEEKGAYGIQTALQIARSFWRVVAPVAARGRTFLTPRAQG